MNATQDAFQLQQALLALAQLQEQLSRPVQVKSPAAIPSFAQTSLVASAMPQQHQQKRHQVSIPSLRQQLVSSQIPKPVAPKVFLTERARFFAFTKVLFRYLKKAKVDDRRAKLVVAKCVKQSQMGLSPSLVAQLEQELRLCVGDVHWARATLCFNSYCSKLGLGCNAMRAV